MKKKHSFTSGTSSDDSLDIVGEMPPSDDCNAFAEDVTTFFPELRALETVFN